MLLATDLEGFVNNVGLTALAIPIVHAIAGFVPSILKQWFIPKREFSQRQIFLKEKLVEESCKGFAYTIDRAINSEDPIRGNAAEKPDLVSNYHRENYKLCMVGFSLERAYLRYSSLTALLQIIAVLGLILIVTTFILSKISPVLVIIPLILSSTCILLELISICILINKVNLLEKYEHVHLK